ncbi:MAG: ribulose-phosphate 3-epimerase [Bacteroidales bacterium]|nr:ribulose-phosphate 3-epimerase [Bacteroidales bacterium]
MSHLVSPSLLAADFGNLERDIMSVNRSYADWLHLDIMDGVFVPNISFGFSVVEAVRKISEKPLDVHLMIIEPERWIDRFADAGASILTVHYEACTHLNRVVNHIRERGMKAGVSLNPHTPVKSLEYILEYVDMVLLMTVNPGYGGQTFIGNSYSRIKELKEMRDAGGHDFLIQVDGGVEKTNAGKLIKAGVDVLVAGSYVFKSGNVEEKIKSLKNIT